MEEWSGSILTQRNMQHLPAEQEALKCILLLKLKHPCRVHINLVFTVRVPSRLLKSSALSTSVF